MVDSTNLPEVDINAIATDLNNKADRDLVNITSSAQAIIDNKMNKDCSNSTRPYVVSRTSNSRGG